MHKILLAGATGYLGHYILKELLNGHIATKLIVRDPGKLNIQPDEEKLISVHQAELPRPVSISGCCTGINTVITTVGITRAKEGLTYQQIDYQANLNLLNEAKRNGVRKFIYIGVEALRVGIPRNKANRVFLRHDRVLQPG